MSRKYKFHNPKGLYFISFAAVYWIDVFIRSMYKDILFDSINYCIKNKGLIVYGYVLMSSHVHMIFGTKEEKPENIVRYLKRHISNLEERLIKHNAYHKGFTGNYNDWEVEYFEIYDSKAEAYARERQVKKCKNKTRLKAGGTLPSSALTPSTLLHSQAARALNTKHLQSIASVLFFLVFLL